jgi:hypothetical protein
MEENKKLIVYYMSSFINFITVFFIFLILYQIFLAFFQDFHFEEGFGNQYVPYDTNKESNVMILAQQNAGNIIVLKQQMDGLMSLNKDVKDLKNDMKILQDQMTQMVAAQQQYASQMTPTPAPTITGVVPEN